MTYYIAMPDRKPAWKLRAMMAIVAPLLLAGCGGIASPSDEALATFSLTSRAGIDTYAVVPDQLKLAAANIFRDLAVQALSEAPPPLRQRAGDALFAEKGVHRSLGINTQREILPYLTALDAAAGRGDRTEVAASALQVSRLLCLDLSSAADKQADFALIDNALLTAHAGIKGDTIDWDAVDAALTMADDRRGSLEGLGPDRGFEVALADLSRATQDRRSSEMPGDMDRTRRSFDAYRAAYDSALPDQALVAARDASR